MSDFRNFLLFDNYLAFNTIIVVVSFFFLIGTARLLHPILSFVIAVPALFLIDTLTTGVFLITFTHGAAIGAFVEDPEGAFAFLSELGIEAGVPATLLTIPLLIVYVFLNRKRKDPVEAERE